MWVIAMYFAFDIWGLISGGNSGVAYLSHVVGFAMGSFTAASLLWFKWTEMGSNEKSLLQVWRLMPHADNDPKPVPAITLQTSTPVRRSPPPRKPRDETPIQLD